MNNRVIVYCVQLRKGRIRYCASSRHHRGEKAGRPHVCTIGNINDDYCAISIKYLSARVFRDARARALECYRIFFFFLFAMPRSAERRFGVSRHFIRHLCVNIVAFVGPGDAKLHAACNEPGYRNYKNVHRILEPPRARIEIYIIETYLLSVL